MLVCLAFFLAFLGAQSATGWHVYNGGNEDHGQETIGYLSYLTSGHFVEGTFENWESVPPDGSVRAPHRLPG